MHPRRPPGRVERGRAAAGHRAGAFIAALPRPCEHAPPRLVSWLLLIPVRDVFRVGVSQLQGLMRTSDIEVRSRNHPNWPIIVVL